MKNLSLIFSGVVLSQILIGFSAQAEKVDSAHAKTAKSATTKNAPSTRNSRDLCDYGSVGVIATAKPSTAPNYFFRTFDKNNTEYVSYAASGNLIILNFKTNREYPFAGNYDPVPMNSDIITTPNGGLQLYSIDDILRGNSSPRALNSDGDHSLPGVYQSVGKLHNAGEYRIVSDSAGASAVDYKVSGRNDVEMIRNPTIVCPNTNIKLPMLSKDGTMLSAFDSASSTTKIWKIDFENHKCNLLMDLGVGVGKADFSYDNQKITFHTASTNNGADYFAHPSDTMNMNVYVFDIKNKTLQQMTQNQVGDNSYYPVFRPDGTIIYSQVAANGDVQFVHANPARVPSVPFDPSRMNAKKRAELFSIGEIWSAKCKGKFADGSASSVTTALNLDPAKCRQLVDQFWDSKKDEIAQLAAGDPNLTSDVMAACPTHAVGTQAMSDASQHQGNDHLPAGEAIMASKCSICHSNFWTSQIQANSLSADIKKEILRRINLAPNDADKMPKIGELSSDEKTSIERFVKSL